MIGGFPQVLGSTSHTELHGFACNSCSGEMPAERSDLCEGDVNPRVPRKQDFSGMGLSLVSPVPQRGWTSSDRSILSAVRAAGATDVNIWQDSCVLCWCKAKSIHTTALSGQQSVAVAATSGTQDQRWGRSAEPPALTCCDALIQNCS